MAGAKTVNWLLLLKLKQQIYRGTIRYMSILLLLILFLRKSSTFRKNWRSLKVMQESFPRNPKASSSDGFYTQLLGSAIFIYLFATFLTKTESRLNSVNWYSQHDALHRISDGVRLQKSEQTWHIKHDTTVQKQCRKMVPHQIENNSVSAR